MGSKTVLITGASRGIGRACALAFAHAGWNVAVNYLNSGQEALTLLDEIKSAGSGGIAVCADVSSPDQAEMLFNKTAEKFGGIDAVINNAGIAQKSSL